MAVLTDAPFYAPLKTSLLLSNGSGNATFTRATTATVFDNEGKLITVSANVPRFVGARRVENLIDNTVLPSIPTGTGNVTLSSGVYTLNNSASGSFTLYRFASTTNIVGTQYRATLQVRRISASGTLTVDIGDLNTTILNPSDNNWFTYTTPIANTVTASKWFDLQTSANAVYEVKFLQLENVTGQDDQTMSEYVVGTQWFANNKNGSSITDASLQGCLLNPTATTNNLLYCRDLTFGGNKTGADNTLPYWYGSGTGSELITNGTFNTDTSGWTAVNSTLSSVAGVLRIAPTANNGAARQTITTEIGTTYVITGTLTDINGSSVSHKILVGSTAGASNLGCCDLKSIVGTPINMFFTAIGTSTHISIYSFEGSLYHEWDNISVKKAGIQPVLNQVGIDKMANSCSLLTATASNATVLQTITAASAPACSSFHVKRITGSGSIYFTRDNTNWTDVTSLINSNSYTRVKIENTSVTNPQVGFKIANSGDAIAVDYGQNEAGIEVTMPILTTNAAVIRNADVLTYPSANNYSSISGTVICKVSSDNWNNSNGSIIGSSTRGLFMIPSGVQLQDGTNIVNGPNTDISNSMNVGYTYSGSTMKAFINGVIGSSGSYDGAWNLSSIGIASGQKATIRDLAIWQSVLSDREIISLTVIDANDKYIIKNARRQAVVSIRGSGQANISVQELACSDQTVDAANVDLSITGMYYQLFSAANVVRNGNVILNLVPGYDSVKFSEDFGYALNRNSNSNVIVNLGGGNNFIAFQLTKGVGYNETDRQPLLPWQR